jgi:hypothetical protein
MNSCLHLTEFRSPQGTESQSDHTTPANARPETLEPSKEDKYFKAGPSNISRRGMLLKGLLAGGAAFAALHVTARKSGALKVIDGAGQATGDQVVPTTYNVRDYGALGNGNDDDAPEINAAIQAALANQQGGTVFFPTGRYLVRSSLKISAGRKLQIVGEGRSAEILWGFNGHLFDWVSGSTPVECFESTIRDLMVTAHEDLEAIGAQNAAFYCRGGCARTIFSNILVMTTVAGPTYLPGSGIWVQGVTDSVMIENCQFWNIKGTGIRLGHGSEIFVSDTRIIGAGLAGSIGINITGGQGGVYLESLGIISLEHGVRIAPDGGVTNREIFFANVALDSCDWGLAIYNEGCFVTFTGGWIGSCKHAGIVTDGGSPTLNVSGTVLMDNGGPVATNPNYYRCGMIINSGQFNLTGLTVTFSRAIGIWVPNTGVKNYTITGCTVVNSSAQGAVLSGHRFVCASNVFTNNGQPNYVWNGATNFVYANNVEVNNP